MRHEGQCPRCGATPVAKHVGHNKKAVSATHRIGENAEEPVFGTLFDGVLREWSCLDCGCQFSSEGKARHMTAEWGFEGETRHGYGTDGQKRPASGS